LTISMSSKKPRAFTHVGGHQRIARSTPSAWRPRATTRSGTVCRRPRRRVSRRRRLVNFRHRCAPLRESA
jgi:hypothetical protein